MKAYLAGGLKTDWQARVMSAVPQAEYLNPMDIQHLPLNEVVEQELGWLRECDMVFAYMEKDNPSGIGLAAEIGFATALGKLVIFVDEKNDSRTRWLALWRCDTVGHLQGGIDLLRTCVRR